MIITQAVYNKIDSTIGSLTPECYGVLGRKNDVVTEYIFCGSSHEKLCLIDAQFINSRIADWEDLGIQFAGIVHSHPYRGGYLSAGDKRYIMKLAEINNQLLRDYQLYFPIALPSDVMHSFVMVGYKLVHCNSESIICHDDIYIEGGEIIEKL